MTMNVLVLTQANPKISSCLDRFLSQAPLEELVQGNGSLFSSQALDLEPLEQIVQWCEDACAWKEVKKVRGLEQEIDNLRAENKALVFKYQAASEQLDNKKVALRQAIEDIQTLKAELMKIIENLQHLAQRSRTKGLA